jgi:hypothetical protein
MPMPRDGKPNTLFPQDNRMKSLAKEMLIHSIDCHQPVNKEYGLKLAGKPIQRAFETKR